MPQPWSYESHFEAKKSALTSLLKQLCFSAGRRSGSHPLPSRLGIIQLQADLLSTLCTAMGTLSALAMAQSLLLLQSLQSSFWEGQLTIPGSFPLCRHCLRRSSRALPHHLLSLRPFEKHTCWRATTSSRARGRTTTRVFARQAFLIMCVRKAWRIRSSLLAGGIWQGWRRISGALLLLLLAFALALLGRHRHFCWTPLGKLQGIWRDNIGAFHRALFGLAFWLSQPPFAMGRSPMVSLHVRIVLEQLQHVGRRFM